MAYYGYQYKQQCYVPGGVKQATPVFMQCHHPGAAKCVSCTPCASKGAKLYTVRKTTQSSPQCSTPCSSRCVETQIVEGPSSSSCGPRSPHPCTMVSPQPYVQCREHLCVPHCGQQSFMRCPQMCAPAHGCQHRSCPYSYHWSNSYHYSCGQH